MRRLVFLVVLASISLSLLLGACDEAETPVEQGTTWPLSKACAFVVDRPFWRGGSGPGHVALWQYEVPALSVLLGPAGREGFMEAPSNTHVDVAHDTAFRHGDLVIDVDRRTARTGRHNVTWLMTAYGSKGTARSLSQDRGKAFSLLEMLQCDGPVSFAGVAGRHPPLSARLLARNDRIVLQLVNVSLRDVDVGAQFPESPDDSGHRLTMRDPSTGAHAEGWKETLQPPRIEFPSTRLAAGQMMQREYTRDAFLAHFMFAPSCADYVYAYRRDEAPAEDAAVSAPLRICREQAKDTR